MFNLLGLATRSASDKLNKSKGVQKLGKMIGKVAPHVDTFNTVSGWLGGQQIDLGGFGGIGGEGSSSLGGGSSSSGSNGLVGAYNSPVKEPQRSYMWEVSFVDPFDPMGTQVKFYAKATGIPTAVNETIKRYHAGVQYAYPSRDTSPKIFRVTLWDNQELEVYRYFNTWLHLMQYGAGNAKVNPANYFRDIRLTMQDSTGTVASQEFLMRNCFPTEISEVSLTYMESSEMTFDVMFHFHEKVIV